MKREGRLRLAISRLGINRSRAIRMLTRAGNPRLRTMRARAAGTGARAALMRAAVGRLEAGTLTVPVGRGEGLVLDLRRLRIDHAHIGSIAHGLLEMPVQEAIVRHLGPGGVLYDIGANLGFFSLLGARIAGPTGHVYAFDPVPENAEAVRAHAELNGLGNVTVIAKAAAAAAGVGRLQIVDDRSWSKLEEYGEHPGTERVLEVELVSIDELLSRGELRPPTLVKIDVEGAELAVLEGMRKTIARHRPAIICELHDTHAAFVAAMAEHSYRVINLEGTAPVGPDRGCEHALALPPLHRGD